VGLGESLSWLLGRCGEGPALCLASFVFVVCFTADAQAQLLLQLVLAVRGHEFEGSP